MFARNKRSVTGRIQKRKAYHLQIITFGLQRAAGPYNGFGDGKTRLAWPRPCESICRPLRKVDGGAEGDEEQAAPRQKHPLRERPENGAFTGPSMQDGIIRLSAAFCHFFVLFAI
jgi:hypothetical protein